MGHARHEDLRDLDDVLAEIRAWPGVAERAAGVFSLGRRPFLHFHARGAARWADARTGRTWGPEIPLPFDASRTVTSAFMREARARYLACVESGRRAARSGRGGRASDV